MELARDAIAVLSSASRLWASLPFAAVFAGHSLFCALPLSEFRDRWLVHYIVTFLWGNGGGLTTALLIMSPMHAKLSVFASNEVLCIWTLCWWLVNYLPGGHVYAALSWRPAKALAKACTALLRAQLIVARVDLAVALFPGVAAAPLLLGTLGGCGGRLIADAMLSSWQALPGYAEITSPGFVSRSAFVAACGHYALAHVAAALPRDASAGLVVSLLVLHSLLSELLGRPLDFTAPLSRLAHALTCALDPRPVLRASAVLRRTGARLQARRALPRTGSPRAQAESAPDAARRLVPPTPAQRAVGTRARASDRAVLAASTASGAPATKAAAGVSAAKRRGAAGAAVVAGGGAALASGASLVSTSSLAATRTRRSVRRDAAGGSVELAASS